MYPKQIRYDIKREYMRNEISESIISTTRMLDDRQANTRKHLTETYFQKQFQTFQIPLISQYQIKPHCN